MLVTADELNAAGADVIPVALPIFVDDVSRPGRPLVRTLRPTSTRGVEMARTMIERQRAYLREQHGAEAGFMFAYQPAPAHLAQIQSGDPNWLVVRLAYRPSMLSPLTGRHRPARGGSSMTHGALTLPAHFKRAGVRAVIDDSGQQPAEGAFGRPGRSDPYPPVGFRPVIV